MLSAALVPLSMLLANFATLATQLLVPRFLSPREYATFAVLWATGQFLASAGFEWARLAVLRFSIVKDSERGASNRRVLLRAYVLTAVAMIAGSVALCIIAFAGPRWFAYRAAVLGAAAVLYYAACQGTFEGGQAITRARFQNTRFSVGWLCRTALSLVGALGASFVSGSGTWALIGLATSYPLSMLLFWIRDVRQLKVTRRPADREPLRFLLHYGAFAAASTITSNFLPAAVRLLCTQVLSLGVAGGVLLALDLSQKALMVVGLAVNLIVMQQSIRATEFGGDEARRMQLSRQVSVPFALITPTAVGFYLIQPTFTLFAVPETYRLIYEANVGWASLAAALLGLRLFSVDPLFIAAGRSRLTVLGPLASLFITSAGVWLGGGIFGYNDRLISAATAVGLGGGLLVSTFMAMWKLDIRWPYRDVIITLIATTAMSAVFLLVVSGTSIMRCMGAIVLASVTYGLVCWVLNLCSVRDLVSVRLKPS